MRKFTTAFAVLLLCTALTFAQSRQITGQVKDDKGAPIPYATVKVKGNSKAVSADQDGNFKIEATSASELLISATGYSAAEVKVGDGSELVVALKHVDTQLNEVVVTAMGISREKKTVGYSTSQFNSEQITKTAPVSMLDGLQGKIAGADISSTGGAPGSSSKVVLRGYSSVVGTNQPLYVIDGVPMNNSRPGSSSENLDFGNAANDINPNDIASLNVLKGAAATALYGSRAASGVIIITTKKGAAGNLKIDINSGATFSNVGKTPTFQDKFGQGWPTFVLSENGSWGPVMDGITRPWGSLVDEDQLSKPFAYVKNNIRNFYTTGHEYNNSISLSGGNEKSTFYLSYGNVSSDGVIPTKNDSYVRNTIGLRGSTKTDRFTVSMSLNYVNKHMRAISTKSGNTGSSVFEDLIQIPVDIDIAGLANYRGKFYNVDDYFTPFAENPYYSINENKANTNNDRIFGNMDFSYKLNAWLTAQWRVGADITNARTQAYKNYNNPGPGSWNGGENVEGAVRAEDIGGVDESSDYFGEYNSDLMLSAKKDLASKFTIDGMIGFNYNQRDQRSLYSSISNLTIPGYFNLNNSKNPPISSTYMSNRRLIGAYAQATLGYDDYLYLTVTARNDWSSTLPKNKNNFFYPGVNAAFILSQAVDLKDAGISFAKIRASIGQTGTDASPYQIASVLNTGVGSATANGVPLGYGVISFPFNGIPSFTIGNSIGNPSLKPQISTEYEFGGEFKFLKNRLGFDLSYYNKRTKDQILSVPITPSSGYTGLVNNFGVIQNKGIELSVNIVPVQSDNFRWEMSYVFSRNRNKVLSLPEGLDQVILNSAYDAQLVAATGQPLGVFMAPTIETDGKGHVVVNARGMPLATTDNVSYGTSQRNFMMGLVNTFTYKAFSLGFSLDYRKGGKFYSGTADLLSFVGNAYNTTYNDRRPFVVPNSVQAITDAATGKITGYIENTVAINNDNMYNYYYPSGQKATTYQNRILDKAFFKMRDVSLTYTFPKTIISKISSSKTSISVFARNILLWTPRENTYIDPEASNQGNDLSSEFGEFRTGPTTQSYGVALKLSF